MEVEVHAVDGMHTAERDANAVHLHQRHGGHRWHSCCHELRRRRSESRPTAATRTMPTTMSWVGESTRRSSMPERSDCITTAPSTAPGMVPTPPANEVPPI